MDDYTEPRGRDRLRELFETDVLPVPRFRTEDQVIPDSFAALLPALGEALARIRRHPVSAEDHDEGWTIVVAHPRADDRLIDDAATVAYLGSEVGDGRSVAAAGRWFGFHPGSQDLVRLYVSPPRASDRPDLHAALESFYRGEEELREDLVRYPGLSPAMVPPLVVARYPMSL